MSKSICFIDARIAHYQALVADLSADSEIILIGSGNGLQHMADALAGRSGIDAIHVLSHGSAGALQLGDTLLSSDNLNAYAPLLAQIGRSLVPDGDLLLYGCNVAQGDAGRVFVESIARITQADVAASEDLTGAAALGGDWNLEASTGQIESLSLESNAYAGALATTLGNIGSTEQGSYNFDQLGQAFVATQTGRLENITVKNTGTFSGGWSLKVFSGNGAYSTAPAGAYNDGTLKTPIATVSGTSMSNGNNAIDFSSQNVMLTLGQTYTFMFFPSETPASTYSLSWGAQNSYAGGFGNWGAYNTDQNFDLLFSVTIGDANTAPSIADLDTDSVAWAGVAQTVTLDQNTAATVTDTELGALNSGNGDWSGASLTVQRSGTAVPADVLGFNTTGAPFTVSGNNLQAGGQTFATFTNTGGVLTINFSSSGTTATTALVQAVA